VGAGSKEDLQGVVAGLQGHVGLVGSWAAAGEGGWGGKGRRLLVQGVVASSAGGSGTLRSGARETGLEERLGVGSGKGSTGGARKMSLRWDMVGEEKD